MILKALIYCCRNNYMDVSVLEVGELKIKIASVSNNRPRAVLLPSSNMQMLIFLYSVSSENRGN